ncbi:MAG: hypothetical protein ACRDO7_18230, partial [Nocardioidaceae bacterium]
MSDEQPAQWVGARLPRREDARMLRGAGSFVDDIADPHALHAAFVRSPVAAGRIVVVDGDAAASAPGVVAVLTAADLGHPQLTAALERDEFTPTSMPLLAYDRVRYVGEPVAIVVAESRYLAEDAAEDVICDIEETAAVLTLDDLGPEAPALHDEAPDNVLVDMQMFEDDLLSEALGRAPLV